MRRPLEEDTSRASEEDNDGGAGLMQGCGRASEGKFSVQTYGLEGASEGVQAEAWHGPVGFRKARGCTEKDWACGKRVGDGWPWDSL